MKVSIITVCLNSEKTIEQTILSVINQSYDDIEYIIVDGNSSDNTLEIVNKYRDQISCIISEVDNGLYHAMNKGIELSSGSVVGILNSDDFYEDSSVISDVMMVFKTNPNFDACYGNLKIVNQENVSKLIRSWVPGTFEKKKFKYGWVFPHPSLFVSKIVYENSGNFNTKYSTNADFEFMFRCFYVNDCTANYIDRHLVVQRAGGISMSLKRRIIANFSDKSIWGLHGFTVPWYFRFLKPLRKIPQYIKAFTHLRI